MQHRSRPLLVCASALCLTLASQAHAQEPSATPEPPRGVGMMAAGGATLGASIPLLVLGLVQAGGGCLRGPCEDSATDLTSGTGLIVVSMLGALAGSALLGYGGMRHRQWRQWRTRHTPLTPRVSRSPAGTWTVGLALRF